MIYVPNPARNSTEPKLSEIGKCFVVHGPMKSAKTRTLIETANLYRRDGATVFVVKPTCDTRSPQNYVRDRDGNQLAAYEIEPSCPFDLVQTVLPALPHKPDWVFIDEAQFFSAQIYDTVLSLILKKINVFVAGLTTDFVGRPFGYLSLLFPLLGDNGRVVHLQAQCEHPGCLLKADFHQRTVGGVLSTVNDPVVVIDGAACDVVYSPRCRNHFSFFF